MGRLSKLRQLPGFGRSYSPGEDPLFITDQQVEVWMHQKGEKARFFDRSANQVGDEHATALSAILWAYAHGWVNPASPVWLNTGFVCQPSGDEPNPTNEHVLFIP